LNDHLTSLYEAYYVRLLHERNQLNEILNNELLNLRSVQIHSENALLSQQNPNLIQSLYTMQAAHILQLNQTLVIRNNLMNGLVPQPSPFILPPLVPIPPLSTFNQYPNAPPPQTPLPLLHHLFSFNLPGAAPPAAIPPSIFTLEQLQPPLSVLVQAPCQLYIRLPRGYLPFPLLEAINTELALEAAERAAMQPQVPGAQPPQPPPEPAPIQQQIPPFVMQQLQMQQQQQQQQPPPPMQMMSAPPAGQPVVMMGQPIQPMMILSPAPAPVVGAAPVIMMGPNGQQVVQVQPASSAPPPPPPPPQAQLVYNSAGYPPPPAAGGSAQVAAPPPAYQSDPIF
jgi:hypothetical protein